MALYEPFFRYNLRRLETMSRIRRMVREHVRSAGADRALPERSRAEIFALTADFCRMAREYDAAAADVPGTMLARTRSHRMTMPFREWAGGGFDPMLENHLDRRMFNAAVEVEAEWARDDRHVSLRVTLTNTGFMPWTEDVAPSLVLGADAGSLALPPTWRFAGDPMAFGDTRAVTFKGSIPADVRQARVTVGFSPPLRNRIVLSEQTVRLTLGPDD
jgi:hypothetical protein